MQTVAPKALESSSLGLSCRSVAAHMESQMDSPTASSYAHESARTAKFLCSFGGSILPRPLDGRLRYVGGETRIVTIPCNISFSDLLIRMRGLFEGADVIKYQQPDEDLDALVSVVNDDDVMNMMEENDKFSTSGECYTRLRIFLFSLQQDSDASLVAARYDVDERETERRYVDALNCLADVRSQSMLDYADQFSTTANNDVGTPSHVALRHLNVPQASYGQKYAEVENSRSPAIFSPRRSGIHDIREHAMSPSPVHYQVVTEDRIQKFPEELVRQFSQLYHSDYPSPLPGENIVWLPRGTVIQEKVGFAGNQNQTNNFSDANSTCEQCCRTFQRGRGTTPDTYLDYQWRNAQTHFEQPNTMNDPSTCSIVCPDCCRSREQCKVYMDMKNDSCLFGKDHDNQQICYVDSHVSDSSWHVQRNHNNFRYEDQKMQLTCSSRIMDPYVGDSGSANSSYLPYKVHGMHITSEYNSDMHYKHQQGGGSPYGQASCLDETTGQHHNNSASAYAADTYFQAQNLSQLHSFRRKVLPPVPTFQYELPCAMVPNNGITPSAVTGTSDGSPILSSMIGYDQTQNQRPLLSDGLTQKVADFDAAVAAGNKYVHGSRLISTGEVVQSFHPTVVPCQSGVPLMEMNSGQAPETLASSFQVDDKIDVSDSCTHHTLKRGTIRTQSINMSNEKILHPDFERSMHLDGMVEHTSDEGGQVMKIDEPLQENLSESGFNAANDCQDISTERFNFVPQLIASVQKVALEDADGVAKENFDECCLGGDGQKSKEVAAVNNDSNVETHIGGCGEHKKSKIETTDAEAEALSKGLQTIKNEDLEDIRELGSGTYGSVYHGKWRGSDVAIKRIKASCFTGRPSERERLIADFWKEALILSSLHHPNVVSFYGVVRDGPDGSLATVTEFMVNGSLKQFLQKKDRTIDRRKRLILAMDAAFGMEYLHGKNIVHFDLKCENLLVNMRDPHRPICKIGDLGLSKVKQHTLVSGGVRGTLPWMAPELLSGKSNMVSEKIDVYSFGIVMWELLTGEEPYAEMRCASIIGGIVNNALRPQIPSWCDPEWKSLMESCWDADPAVRPSFSEISQRLRKMAAAINVK